MSLVESASRIASRISLSKSFDSSGYKLFNLFKPSLFMKSGSSTILLNGRKDRKMLGMKCNFMKIDQRQKNEMNQIRSKYQLKIESENEFHKETIKNASIMDEEALNFIYKHQDSFDDRISREWKKWYKKEFDDLRREYQLELTEIELKKAKGNDKEALKNHLIYTIKEKCLNMKYEKRLKKLLFKRREVTLNELMLYHESKVIKLQKEYQEEIDRTRNLHEEELENLFFKIMTPEILI